MKIILKGKDNIFEQIVSEYKRFISLKVFKQDEKLPSVRELAKDLGINPNTVSKAYQILEEEGYIKILPKKGVYVDYKEGSAAASNPLKDIITNLKNDGYTEEEIIATTKLVYKEVSNDWNFRSI